MPATELYEWAKQNNFLKATEQQILSNIGGMGKHILIETPELSIKKRKALIYFSKVISKLVRLRYKAYNLSIKLNSHKMRFKSIPKKIHKILHWGTVYIKFLIKGNHRMFSIYTHLTEIERLLLYKLTLSLESNSTIVEIGSYLGASSCFLGCAAKNRGHKVYCVDTWQNDAMTEGQKDTFIQFMENTKDVSNFIYPLRGKSTEVANIFTETIGLIFIDGDHSYEGVKADVKSWLPKLKDGGIVVFHDIGWQRESKGLLTNT